MSGFVTTIAALQGTAGGALKVIEVGVSVIGVTGIAPTLTVAPVWMPWPVTCTSPPGAAISGEAPARVNVGT